MGLRRIVILLLVAGLVVLLALVGYSAYVNRENQLVTVVAANVDIPANTWISEEMLGAVRVQKPDPGTPSYYVYDPKAIAGKQALQAVLVGQPIDSRGVGTEPPPGRALTSGELVPPGERALAIPVDQLLAVGGAVRAGDLLTLYKAEEDWAAMELWFRAVQDLNTKLQEEATVPGGAVLPGGSPATGATTENQIKPELLLQLNPVPLRYSVLYQHVRVVDLRQGPITGGNSLLRGEAKAGDAGATFLLLDLTDEQAQQVLAYLYQGRLSIAIEGDIGGK